MIDSIITGFQVARTGMAVAADESDYAGTPLSRGADIAFGLAFTGLFLGSAIYGFSNTSECADLKRRIEEPPPPPDPSAAPGAGGCRTDLDCKGDRVCHYGRCSPPTVRE